MSVTTSDRHRNVGQDPLVTRLSDGAALTSEATIVVGPVRATANPREEQKAAYIAAANSEMNRAAAELLRLVEELAVKAAVFAETFDENSIVRDMRTAGVKIKRLEPWQTMALSLLSDARGLAYNAELSASLLGGEVIDRNGTHND